MSDNNCHNFSRAYYSDTIEEFIAREDDSVLGRLVAASDFEVRPTQTNAWQEQIKILKNILSPYKKQGKVYFEYVIPRLGGRIDVVLVIKHAVFVLEFKAGAEEYDRPAIDQVCDYALDLKNFHDTSHASVIAPVLVATAAGDHKNEIKQSDDKLLLPLKSNANNLADVMELALRETTDKDINPATWEQGQYCPTPTIIEAAMALYGGHAVEEISRNDAGAYNLASTSRSLAEIIRLAKDGSRKAICFVTGVPGAGKTLVGLDIATQHTDKDSELYSVFLSGNGPLVNVLREALAQDKVRREREKGKRVRLGEARDEVKMFIQNVHHFRDDCLADDTPPIEHVVLFDEAQRAWNHEMTVDFMRRKRGIDDFDMSEPEFLISCMDRHKEWAVIVCLVGGGQEINRGEAGISGWLNALNDKFSEWDIYISNRLTDSEYESGEVLSQLTRKKEKDNLHLATSMRSFRAENVSLLVKQVLDIEENAQQTLKNIENYPIYLTRSFDKAKEWVRKQARGSERYGMVVSSKAERLKPYAVDVRPDVNPVHWFLKDKSDVRSSYYLEDVATEFAVQGLELDWTCMAWDADFRYNGEDWDHWEFKGDRWNQIVKEHRQSYQKNAYRVLLTRARQGMVIIVPEGDEEDHTRLPEFYDPTYKYLKEIGFQVI